MSVFIPSVQQKTYFNWIENETGSCIVEATAGSGKTTTLTNGLSLMKGSIFFGAFNKDIVREIIAKTEGKGLNLNVSTFHAAGLNMWKKIAKYVKVDGYKCSNIAKDIIDYEDKELTTAVLHLVSFAKQAAIGIYGSVNNDATWYELIDHFDIDCLDKEQEVVAYAKKVLNVSNSQAINVIDFDDMIYIPLINKCNCVKYDWVLIDEAQDTNEARRALALMMLKKGGRLVAVGDRNQNIYGFTGCDSDSLDKIKKAVDAVEIPLTVSYRCPKAIVEEARKYVSHITAHEDAPEGIVSHLTKAEGEDEVDLTVHAKIGDTILCRFNAPIMQLVYKFINKGIPAKVEGRDIGNGLKALARKWKVKNFSTLLTRLETFESKEVAKFSAKEKMKVVSVQDKVNCLKVIIDRVMTIDPKCKNPIDRICEEIDTIFADNIGNNVVLLSTIHKSKGREWKKVFFIQGSADWCRQEWEKQTEKNLIYVAITRAKEELVLCPRPPKK